MASLRVGQTSHLEWETSQQILDKETVTMVHIMERTILCKWCEFSHLVARNCIHHDLEMIAIERVFGEHHVQNCKSMSLVAKCHKTISSVYLYCVTHIYPVIHDIYMHQGCQMLLNVGKKKQAPILQSMNCVGICVM